MAYQYEKQVAVNSILSNPLIARGFFILIHLSKWKHCNQHRLDLETPVLKT